MGMGIGINAAPPDEGPVKGLQEPVACYVWFTSTGMVMPKRLKYQGPDGLIHEIRGIQVLAWKQTYYCGIPAIRYECRCMRGRSEVLFILLFYLEEHIWKLLWLS